MNLPYNQGNVIIISVKLSISTGGIQFANNAQITYLN